MKQSKQPNEYYAVHIPSPSAGVSVEGAVFTTLREASNFANTPESKAKGARFKRFQSQDDAKDYAENGDMFCKSSEILSECQAVGEPSSSFPSVSRIMFNRLKKAIELKDYGSFLDMALRNPRYLINIGSDTPAIVVEGFRYNAMHLAAKVGNLDVAKYILHFICDSEALLTLYGTSKDDVRMRSRILLDCYLNMPDKGSHDTPLHFASKFGQYHLAELFLRYNVCQKNLTNKMGFTPAQICCSRYVGQDKEDRLAVMMPLFFSYFVALYRPTDNYYSVTIQFCDELPPNTVLNDACGSSVCTSALETCELAAYAGPFTDEAMAQKFYQTWKMEKKYFRKRYPRKGAERVGRRLASEYKIAWMERWNFCNKLLDFQSYSGLEELNRHLVNIRLNLPVSPVHTINFDCDDCRMVFTDASDTLFIKNQRNACGTKDSQSTSHDGLTDKFAGLHLDSKDHVSDDAAAFVENSMVSESFLTSNSGVVVSSVQQTCDTDERNGSIDFDYHTPPSSPDPVYIYEGIPSKDDEELAVALSLVDHQLIQRFGAVAEYLRHVRSVPETERFHWPFTDSPRAKRRKK